MLTKLNRKIFFDRIYDGLDLFVDCLGFKMLRRDDGLDIVARDGATANLAEEPAFGAENEREGAIETDVIEAEVATVAGRRPDVAAKRWGRREFTVLAKRRLRDLPPMVRPIRVGLILDTHGCFGPRTLQGCDLIFHAKDVCDASASEAVRAI